MSRNQKALEWLRERYGKNAHLLLMHLPVQILPVIGATRKATWPSSVPTRMLRQRKGEGQNPRQFIFERRNYRQNYQNPGLSLP
jgi:hypothetical protein